MLQKRQLPKNSPALSDCAQSFVICPNDSYLMSTEQTAFFLHKTTSEKRHAKAFGAYAGSAAKGHSKEDKYTFPAGI